MTLSHSRKIANAIVARIHSAPNTMFVTTSSYNGELYITGEHPALGKTVECGTRNSNVFAMATADLRLLGYKVY